MEIRQILYELFLALFFSQILSVFESVLDPLGVEDLQG